MTPLAFRFAARELRSGVRGFRVFLACLALGVAAIAAAGSTAEAFRKGLASEAQTLLGGDVSASSERGFTPAQRKVLASQGAVAYASVARGMAEAPSGERRMVEIRGVDRAYPLRGVVALIGPDGRDISINDALDVGRVPGAAVEQSLLDRMGLQLGQTFTVADKPFVARAVLDTEPDRLTRGFALGPRVLVRMAAYDKAGFRKSPGFQGEAARLLLPEGRTPRQAADAIRRALPKAGLQIRERADAAPGARRLIDQLEYFLGFIGLSSLVAGGLGVSGAVSAYLNARRPSIATLKALGATAGLIRDLHLIQIALLAALGIAIGLVVGAAAPFAVGQMAGDDLPVPALFDIYPDPLLRAAAFGALAAAAFSLGPLARARATPPASLFRRQLTGRAGFGPETLVAILAGLGLAALAVWTAPTREAAAVMIAGVIAAFAGLWLIGRIAAWAGGRLRGLATGPVRLGLANLAGPRSAARTAAPAMGLGVALLAAVALIQASLIREISVVAPQTAPALVFTDIPASRTAEFDRRVAGAIGELSRDRYLRMPFVTGRIIRIRGEAVDRAAIEPAGKWAFDRDIAMAAIGGEPVGASIEAGRWWPARYRGSPLIALEQDAAKAAGVKVGDEVTLLIAGREMDARVAVLRRVNFGSFGPSFGVVVNAAALAGANLQNVAIAKADKAQEARVLRDLATPFPQVNVITVREQLEAALRMFDKLSLAVRAAAGVAALAGLLVLTGAIAAGARDRAREAAIFKVLGASRLQVLAAYAVEYGAVGLIAGAAGAALGAAAAWGVIEKLLKLHWEPDWPSLTAMVVGAALAAALGGLIAAWRALAERPAPVLRAD